MRYSIEGFQQDKLVEYGLDSVDAVILRWFVDFIATGKMQVRVIDGVSYYWVNYSYVIEQLPVLGISAADSVGRRFKKMLKAGVIIKTTVRVQGASMVFLSPNTEKFSSLISHPTQKSVVQPTSEAGVHPTQKSAYSSSKEDSSSKDIKNKSQAEPDGAVNELKTAVIEYLNTALGTSFRPGAKLTTRLIKARSAEGYTLDNFKKVIDFKVSDWLGNTKMQQYLRPDILFGSKFEGYLQTSRMKVPTEEDKRIDREIANFQKA